MLISHPADRFDETMVLWLGEISRLGASLVRLLGTVGGIYSYFGNIYSHFRKYNVSNGEYNVPPQGIYFLPRGI